MDDKVNKVKENAAALVAATDGLYARIQPLYEKANEIFPGISMEPEFKYVVTPSGLPRVTLKSLKFNFEKE